MSVIFIIGTGALAEAAYHFSDYRVSAPIHIYGSAHTSPSGMAPQQIKATHNLPISGGKGTVVLIGAYDDPSIESDLKIFSAQFGLTPCTTANGCFEKYKMSSTIAPSSSWSMG